MGELTLWDRVSIWFERLGRVRRFGRCCGVRGSHFAPIGCGRFRLLDSDGLCRRCELPF